jgi:hypothetical protein
MPGADSYPQVTGNIHILAIVKGLKRTKRIPCHYGLCKLFCQQETVMTGKKRTDYLLPGIVL